MTASPRPRRARLSLLAAVAVVLAAGGPAAPGAEAAPEQQPHMQAALEALRSAQAHLEQATADKGGHRVRAQRLTREAIQQVERGIEYDRRH